MFKLPALSLVALASLLLIGVSRSGHAFPTNPIASDEEQVAIETDGGTKALIFLGGNLNEEDLTSLQREAPNLTIITPSSSSDALRHASKAHGMDARYATAEMIRSAPNLVWVQSSSSGVERYLRVKELRESDTIVMTNMQGVHGATIAEHAFAMLLTLTRNMRYYTHPEQKGQWRRGQTDTPPIALHGRTLLVVGLGGIGSKVAEIGNGLGMRVLATRRSKTPPPEYVDYQGTPDELMELLPQADVVALCVPLTDQTRGMIGPAQLAAMKEGSYLINVGRGPVVVTDALVAALEDGHLAGACLDVTDPEPLPSGHPLWAMENVVITPHVSGRSELTSRIWKETYLENLRRFAAGEPLRNVVDKDAGY